MIGGFFTAIFALSLHDITRLQSQGMATEQEDWSVTVSHHSRQPNRPYDSDGMKPVSDRHLVIQTDLLPNPPGGAP